MKGTHYCFYPAPPFTPAPCHTHLIHLILDTISTELVPDDNYQLSCLPFHLGQAKNHKAIKNVVKLPGFESWHLVFETRLCHLITVWTLRPRKLTSQFSPQKVEGSSTFLKGWLQKWNELSRVKHVEWWLARSSSRSVRVYEDYRSYRKSTLRSQHQVGANIHCQWTHLSIFNLLIWSLIKCS